jgi:peptidylprolyl isomerase
MSEPVSMRDRIIGALVVAFVLVFVAFLAWPFLPFGQSDPGPTDDVISTNSTVPVHVIIELPEGAVDIELRPDLAPLHVAQITSLIESGFYDGVVFHRVIDGFMAQTGDPTGTGSGGSDLPDIPAEFTDTPFDRGTIGMARTADPNSANSQFFFMFAPAPHLNGQYTVIGEVVNGMEHIDALKMGDQGRNGQVTDPDAIISMRIVQDE